MEQASPPPLPPRRRSVRPAARRLPHPSAKSAAAAWASSTKPSRSRWAGMSPEDFPAAAGVRLRACCASGARPARRRGCTTRTLCRSSTSASARAALLRDAVHPGPGPGRSHRGIASAPRQPAGAANGSPPSGVAASQAGGLLTGQFRGEQLAAGPSPGCCPCPRDATAASATSSVWGEGDGSPSSAPRDAAAFSSRSDLPFYRSVARLGLQVADALAYAHGQRVLHRDIKPANLLLDTSGTVWVTDFGLAKDEGDDLTRTGDVVGTLRYMAPERLSGTSDARSDLYSLGLRSTNC